MSTTSTDPRAIEADIERDRASLASTLDALSDRVSVDNIAREALGAIKSHAGSYTSSVDHLVRANPLAVALIGAGAAWLVLGNRVGGRGSRVGDDTPPADYGRIDYTTDGSASTSTGGDDDWSHQAHGLRATASSALRRIESDAKSYYESIRDGIAGGAGTVRDFASERAAVVSSFAADLKSKLAHGLEGLSDSSRQTVMAAREKAYAASLRSNQGSQSSMQPGRLMEDHPLVAGAVAFALGAAVAAALPRTDTEDRAFGSERDRLMDEAARLLRSERERAMQIAGSVGQEIKAAAMEVGEELKASAKDTLEAAADKASEAAGRVTDRVVDEVATTRPGQEQGTGQSQSMGSPVIG